MRRAPAVAASVAGFAGILVVHLSSAPPLIGASFPAPGSSSVPTTTSPTTATGPSGTTGPGTTSPVSTSGSSKTAVGNSEQYGYGVLAVKVTEQGGHITDVSVASIQTAEQYSQSLAQQVIPMLRSEVLSAQSANINAISGATYTSEAYAYSVQSALDALGVK
ncbi:MAG: FMN-binding protein [Acidimicrobiales bacterium]